MERKPNRRLCGIATVMLAAREKAGLTQVQAGERAGLNYKTVGRIEHLGTEFEINERRGVTIAALDKLAAVYGLGLVVSEPGQRTEATNADPQSA